MKCLNDDVGVGMLKTKSSVTGMSFGSHFEVGNYWSNQAKILHQIEFMKTAYDG